MLQWTCSSGQWPDTGQRLGAIVSSLTNLRQNQPLKMASAHWPHTVAVPVSQWALNKTVVVSGCYMFPVRSCDLLYLRVLLTRPWLNCTGNWEDLDRKKSLNEEKILYSPPCRPKEKVRVNLHILLDPGVGGSLDINFSKWLSISTSTSDVQFSLSRINLVSGHEWFIEGGRRFEMRKGWCHIEWERLRAAVEHRGKRNDDNVPLAIIIIHIRCMWELGDTVSHANASFIPEVNPGKLWVRRN